MVTLEKVASTTSLSDEILVLKQTPECIQFEDTKIHIEMRTRKYLEDMFAMHRTMTKDDTPITLTAATKTGSQCGNARPISLLALQGLQSADSWLPAWKSIPVRLVR
jgi:hypothetical protein